MGMNRGGGDRHIRACGSDRPGGHGDKGRDGWEGDGVEARGRATGIPGCKSGHSDGDWWLIKVFLLSCVYARW